MNKFILFLPVFFLFTLKVKAQSQHLVSTEREALFVCMVTDKEQIPEANAEVIIKSEDKTITRKGTTDVDGKYVLLVPKGKKYHVTVKKFGYDFEFVSQVPNTKGELEFVQNYIISLVLPFTRSYYIENIEFDLNKWDIKPVSYPILDSLASTFIKNPTFMAEIGGHTDNVGNDAENLRLSQHRAESVRTYLMKKGIAGNRILAKGYGEKMPIDTNDTPEGRSRNRRIAVKVIIE